MQKVYKVVGVEKRYGSNAMGYINSFENANDAISIFEDRLKELNLQDIFPLYEKGKVVKALKGSVGIMCFVSRICAQDFIYNYCELEKGYHKVKIIEVIGLGKPMKKREIISGCMNISYAKEIITKSFLHRCDQPRGCICFSRVRVVE